jgi:uncharacterized protein
MIVGALTLYLRLEGNESLKGKRSVLKSMMARIRNEFNVSIAEVGDNDRWQSATVGVAAVSNDPDYVQGQLARVVQWIEENRLDVTLVDYSIELL